MQGAIIHRYQLNNTLSAQSILRGGGGGDGGGGGVFITPKMHDLNQGIDLQI